MENDMTLDGIIAQLYELGAYSAYKAEFDSVSSIRKKDADACREAANILYVLLDGGIHTTEEAKAFVRGSKALARQYQALYQRHGTAGTATLKDGVWHCPNCNRRTRPGHSFCHWCGKKLQWSRGRKVPL